MSFWELKLIKKMLKIVQFWLAFQVCFGHHLVSLGRILWLPEVFLRGIFIWKLKKNGGFLRFLQLKLVGAFKILTVLFGLFCFFFGRFGFDIAFKMVAKLLKNGIRKWPIKWVKMWLKNDPKTGTSSFTPSRSKVALTASSRVLCKLKNGYFEIVFKIA